MGGNVKKGSKSVPVVFWKMLERKEEDTQKVRNIPLLRYYSVFNADQIEGIAFPENEALVRKEPVRVLRGLGGIGLENNL